MTEWIKCDGEIWDYEKVFYLVKLHNETLRWVWPNAGKLTDVSFADTSGEKVAIKDVAFYREADDEYFEMMNKRDLKF